MFIVLLFLAYVLGSVPTAVWVSKWFFKKDIRNFGSGNAGATNSFRYLGGGWAAFILIVDVLKGALAVLLIYVCSEELRDAGIGMFNKQLLLGATAIVGHIYPIFAGFRGGKGVATLLGAMFVVEPYFTLIGVGGFLTVYFISHYVAFASMTGAVSFSLCVLLLVDKNSPYYWIGLAATCVVSFLIIYKHRSNIIRFFRKEEDKTFFFKKSADKLKKSKEKSAD